MRLRVLSPFTKALRAHPDARQWTANWSGSVVAADWDSIDDVRKEYPSADGVMLPSGAVITVFNVKGNTYRLLTSITYSTQLAAAFDHLTHAEYDKQNWKARYWNES